MGTTAAPAGVETLAPRGLTEEAIACNAILNRIPSLCTRVILLTIHDMDLDKAAGATLRAAMAQAKVSMKLQGQFSACLREVRVAQEMAREAYVPIRHATIAHRDPDALAQHRAIVELDAVRVLKSAEAFYAGVSGFVTLAPPLMKEAASSRGFSGSIG